MNVYAENGKLLGDQYPRLHTIPSLALRQPHDGKGAAPLDSRAAEAIDLARSAGLELDPWQCFVMENMLALREETYWDEINQLEEHKWASYEFGLVVARQNGKGSLLEARELAGLFLFGEKEIIHSAHLFDTSQKHFERIKSLIVNTPELNKEVLRISNSHGSEGIYLKSGQELIFKARSKSAARGFTADLVVFDEAMLNLGSDVVEAALPTISARPNGQILYTGSAGTKDSEHFGRQRNRALKVIDGESEPDPRRCWMEWSIEPHNEFCAEGCTEHSRPEDPKSWARANPAMGFRITEENTQVEFESMSSSGFMKERLSVGDWPTEGGGWRVIPKANWNKREDTDSCIQGKFALAVDSAPEFAWTGIGAAGANQYGDMHIEVTGIEQELVDYRPGIRWAVPRVLAIWKAQKPAFVVIMKSSPAATIIEELESHGVKVISPTLQEYAQACSDIKNGIAPKPGDEPWITHFGQTPLNLAVAGVEVRILQDNQAWSKAESANDIIPLTTTTLAGWGFKKYLYQKVSKPWALMA